MQTNIRLVQKEDLPILNIINIESKQFWNYPTEWIEKWKPDMRITENDLEQQVIYVLEVENAVIGFCAIQELETAYDITNLWVLPASIGKGYGKLLLNSTIEKVVTKKKDLIVEADPNAVPFYSRMGFVQYDQRESFPKGRFLPLMRRTMEDVNK